MIQITIPGEAIPQGRPKFARRGNFVTTYDPAKSRDYKSYVRMLAAQTYRDAPLAGAVSLSLVFYRFIPTSWSKAKIAAALAGEIRPTTKPYLTNIVKGIEDALSGLVWVDDSRIVDIRLRKFYSDAPRVELEIEELSPAAEVKE